MTKPLTFDAPSEVFADHVIVHPPNRLKARVAAPLMPNERYVDPVSRAEYALKLLGEEFDEWIETELTTLEIRRRAARTSGSRSEFEAFYRCAHDIRGQAATLGFPLVGEVADGLCSMIEIMGAEATPAALIDHHVETMRAMVRENVRARDHTLGVALVQRLADLRRQTMVAARLSGGS